MPNEDKIKKAIEESIEEIKTVDDDIMGEAAGVAQALDHLKKALNKVSACLDKRQYQDASNLGYSDVASEFIFLQRTLGGLQQAYSQKQKLVSEIALKSGVGIYEEVEPFVDEILISSKELSEEEKINKWLGNYWKNLKTPSMHCMYFKRRNLTQTKAAKQLGINQPKISALLRGNLAGFSTDRLIKFLNLLGQDVDIVIKPSPRSQKFGHVSVSAV